MVPKVLAEGPTSPFFGGSGKDQAEARRELGLAGVASMVSCRPESATPFGAAVSPGESPEVRALNVEKKNLITYLLKYKILKKILMVRNNNSISEKLNKWLIVVVRKY